MSSDGLYSGRIFISFRLEPSGRVDDGIRRSPFWASAVPEYSGEVFVRIEGIARGLQLC